MTPTLVARLNALIDPWIYGSPGQSEKAGSEIKRDLPDLLAEIERLQEIESAARECDEYLSQNQHRNQIGADSQLHRRLKAALAKEATK